MPATEAPAEMPCNEPDCTGPRTRILPRSPWVATCPGRKEGER